MGKMDEMYKSVGSNRCSKSHFGKSVGSTKSILRGVALIVFHLKR